MSRETAQQYFPCFHVDIRVKQSFSRWQEAISERFTLTSIIYTKAISIRLRTKQTNKNEYSAPALVTRDTMFCFCVPMKRTDGLSCFPSLQLIHRRNTLRDERSNKYKRLGTHFIQ